MNLLDMLLLTVLATLCVFIGVTLALVLFFAPPPRFFDGRPDQDEIPDRKPAMPTPPPPKQCSMPMPTMHQIDLTV